MPALLALSACLNILQRYNTHVRKLCLDDVAQAGQQALLDYGEEWWNSMNVARLQAEDMQAKDKKIREQADMIKVRKACFRRTCLQLCLA